MMGGDLGQNDTSTIHISDDNLEEALDEIERILDEGGDVNIEWNPEESEADVGEEWEAPYGESPDLQPDAFTPVETSDEAS
jgi:hypothetical protein